MVFLDGRLSRISGQCAKDHCEKINKSNNYRPSEFFLGAFELSSKGHDVEIFEIPEREGRKIIWQIAEKTIKPRWLPVKTSVPIIEGVGSLIKNLNTYDVVVATTIGISFSLGLYKLIGALSPPLISIQCGLLNFPASFFRKQVTKLLLKNMVVQLFGDGELDEIKRVYGVGIPIETNYFGVDIDFWNQGEAQNDNGYVLSVGNDSNRDFSTLIRAANKLSHHVKILTKRKISDDIPANVEMIDGSWKSEELSDADLRELYRKASIVVVPLKETFQPSGQSVVLQAMACGKPVVLTKTRGLWSTKNLCDWGNIVLINPENEDEIVDAVERILADNTIKKTLGEGGRSYAINHGNIDAFSNRLEALCSRLV